ncbi:MAG TPA: DUF3313 family protein [Allosphingosinicella sp.]
MAFKILPGVAVFALMAISAAPSLAKPPDTWDGLLKVNSKRLAAVYLLPDADFRGYTKIMIDKPEVAFKKNWVRDYNRDMRSLSGRVDDEDVRRAIDGATAIFQEALADAYRKEGYQIVSQPGTDVLRLSTAIINVDVTAPDVMRAGPSRTFAQEAGEATFVVEVRDSLTGAVLGRAVDRRLAGDTMTLLRNSTTNRGDFEHLFDTWAKISAEGLGALKSASPINAEGRRK